ncbi:MAG TPA: hypothetical protein VNU26_18785 [Mycobacteriales bacterium]|nr:hypothetical protein [Mycobacteriales bacterium]
MTSAAESVTWEQVRAAQQGVLARRQALALGMTEGAWQWLLDSGRVRPLVPGVVLEHLGEPTTVQRAWAAALHCGHGAAVTGDLALVLYGMRLSAPPLAAHVAVPEERVVRRGAVVHGEPPWRIEPHRVRGLDRLRHPVRTPPVVRLPVAVLHAAAQAPTDRAAEWRVAAAVQQRLLRPQDLDDVLRQLPRLRRRALVTDVLADVREGAHAASELAFLRLLRAHGLPRPDRLQRLVRADGKRYLDAWWERRRVAAEIDGAHHVDVAQWDDDVLRANAVVLSERHDRVLLLRFTTGNLRHDEPLVAAQLRSALL